MVAILQTTISYAFHYKKTFNFDLNFIAVLFPKFQLSIN